jgi:hypothetical protein
MERHRKCSTGAVSKGNGGVNRAGRKLHVVDVENLIGRGDCTADELAAAERGYRMLGLVGECDHVVVGCNPYVALAAGLAWDKCRLVTGHGPSGADRALIRVLDHEGVERRFAEVVVASGDGIFLEPVIRIQQHGVRVTVVSRPGSLSRPLSLAASQVVEIDDPMPPAPVANVQRAA